MKINQWSSHITDASVLVLIRFSCIMRQIALFLLLILFKTSNAASKVYTLLRTDTDLPGPYMIFDKSLASGIFEMEFKTFVDKALMLYQDDSGKSDHIMATLQSGRVYFSFYLSNNHTPVVNPVFKSKKKYNDFDWHSLRIERNASVTSIILDNGKERKSYRTKKYLSSFSSNLLIGGFRKDQLVNGISKLDAFIIYASWEKYVSESEFIKSVKSFWDHTNFRFTNIKYYIY